TTRARMSLRTGTAKISSESSISPTVSLSRLRTSAFISLPLGRRGRLCSTADRRRERHVLRRLALHRVLDRHIALRCARHGTAHQEEAALGVDRDDAQVLGRDARAAGVARHLLVLEGAARVLPLAGGTVAAMRDRNAVRRVETAEIVALHDALEAFADRRAGDVHELADDEVIGAELGAHLHDRIGGHPEFGEDALRLDLRLGEMAAHRLRHVLRLAPAGADLERDVAVLLVGALRD